MVVVYSNQNAAFRQDKHGFFSELALKSNVGVDAKIQAADHRAQSIDYSFILRNQNALEVEFTDLFRLLKKQSKTNKEPFWLYCYYCATLLEQFHRAYGQHGKEAYYARIKDEIKKRLQQKRSEAQAEKTFVELMYQSFLNGFNDLASIPFHTSKMRDNVAFANICRIYWIFCRLTITEGLTLANNLHLIEKLDAILGTHTDVDKIIATIQAPTQFITYFSVGFFLMRFAIDFGLLMKHTFFPSESEAINTTPLDRFKHELYKRQCNFANDLVWATVNFLTNYNNISGIPGPIAGYLISVFLVFDLGMAFYKCHLAEEEYKTKKAQYLAEIAEYKNSKALTPEQRTEHLELLREQLQELEFNWKAKEAMFHFVAAAAALFFVAFTASMLLSSPLLVVATYFSCLVGAAMYLSAGVYLQYQDKKLRLEHAQLTGTDLQVAMKECDSARNHFLFTMVKNSVVPVVLITTFAICWPAAVILAAVYMGAELLHAYGQHHDGDVVKQLSLAEPQDEVDPGYGCASGC